MSDSHFAAEWLALREPADHAARSRALAEEVLDTLPAPAGGAGEGAADPVVDLGSGTGSNVRWWAGLLAERRRTVRWTLVDHDPELLARAAAWARDGGHAVRTVEADLAGDGLEAVDGAGLVTASALLDLVSASWLTELARRCRRAGAAALLALSYDGRIEWSGSGHPLDGIVRTLVNRHQRSDKGVGTALGPDAVAEAEARFRAEGFRTRTVDSSWRLDATRAELGRALVQGWVEAATELEPHRADALASWGEARTADLQAGRVELRVGHRDLAALP